MSEIPELPQDILGYLSGLIKPKKYTLINKFCRDLYFRKNGATIRLAKKYPSYDLLTKYRVTILEKFDGYSAREFRQKIGDVEPFAKNVTGIKGNCDAEIYNILVGMFPNLVEFKGTIRANPSNYGKILAYKKLPGIIIYWNSGLYEGLNSLVKLGYNFCTNDGYQFPEVPENNIEILYLSRINQIDINLYTNLKKLHIHFGYDMDLLVEGIKKHKNIRKIVLSNLWYGRDIIKNDGTKIIVKFTRRDAETYASDPEKYNFVKHRIAGFTVRSSLVLEKLINLEKISENKNRPKLSIQAGVNIPDLDGLVELFRVEVASSVYAIIGFYTIRYTLEKITNIDDIMIVVCRTKTGKFKLRQDKNL